MNRGHLLLCLTLLACMHLSQACRFLPLHFHALKTQRSYLQFRSLRVASAAAPTKTDALSNSTAASLLSLLGGKKQAESVDPSFSSQILPYLRFLVPPELLEVGKHSSFDKKSFRKLSSWNKHRILESLIRWPPPMVANLARKVVEWNGDESVVLNSLSEKSYPVPDVEGASENRCQLTKYTHAYRFNHKELNAYFALLFEAIAILAPSVGFNVSLNRFDLFHGHLFLAHNSGRLGILFHAREYPAFNEETFPVHLGYCQLGSNVHYDDSMNLRNILWLAPMPDLSNSMETEKWLSSGSLIVLDAHPDGIIYKELVPYYVDDVRTIYEDAFGAVVVDVNYFSSANVNPQERLFIC